MWFKETFLSSATHRTHFHPLFVSVLTTEMATFLSLMSQNSKFNSTKQGMSFCLTVPDLLTDLSPDEY
jgi:hypothetical protein